jgi:hypothetical protein
MMECPHLLSKFGVSVVILCKAYVFTRDVRSIVICVTERISGQIDTYLQGEQVIDVNNKS